MGKDPGHFSWAKGILGAIQRVRGAGNNPHAIKADR